MPFSNFSDRKFYRDTPLNRATAISPLGNGATEDEIRLASLRTGTISSSTGSIDLSLGSAANFGAIGSILVGDVVSGVDPGTSTYVLLGIVASMTTGGGFITGISLREVACHTLTTVAWAVGGTFINANESFWVSIAVSNDGSLVTIPDLENMRDPPTVSAGGANNSAYLALTQFSDTGNIDTDGTDAGTNIEGIIPSATKFKAATASNSWWNNSGDFPIRVWFSFNPFGSTGQDLPEATLFNLSLVQSLPSVDLPAPYNYSTNGNHGWQP